MKIGFKHKILCVLILLPWNFCIGQEFDSLIKTWTKKDYDNIIACGPGERGPLKRNYILDICVPWTNLFQSSQRGAHLKLLLFVSSKISIGGSVQSAYTFTKENFDFIVKQPYINQNNLGLIVEYSIYRTKRIEMSCLLDNGFIRTELKDYAIKIVNKNIGQKNAADSVSLTYATNKQYYISPMINLSFILFPLKNKYNAQLQLFSQVSYKYLIGATQFGSSRELSLPFAQLGLRLLFRNELNTPYPIKRIKEYFKNED